MTRSGNDFTQLNTCPVVQNGALGAALRKEETNDFLQENQIFLNCLHNKIFCTLKKEIIDYYRLGYYS